MTENTVFTPSNGFVLIKPIEQKSEALDVARDPDKQPAQMGTVIAIGGLKLHESGGYFESGLKVGDIVVFKPYGIDKIYLNSEEHVIIPFENVRGTLNEES